MAEWMSESARTALAEATLAEILAHFNITPTWGVAGLGAAEAKAVMNGDIAVRINVGIEETSDERWSMLQAAMAHRDCKG